MILCLDVGNSQIFGGLFSDDKLLFRFRKSANPNASADELGTFLISVLMARGFKASDVTMIAYCSVVPDAVYSLRNSCRRYFNLEPFALKSGVKTGLNILYKNPLEVGSDRVANAIAATYRFPDTNLIVADFGTALTFCAINHKRMYLGGAIFPGIRIAMESLQQNTAKLTTVEIIQRDKLCGRSTVTGIQSGLYFGYLSIIRSFFERFKEESFKNEPTKTIGTGGMARLFENSNLFDEILPDLVLEGIYFAYQMNKG